MPGTAHGRDIVSGSRDVRHKAVRVGAELNFDVGQLAYVGQQPRLGAVGELAVGEQDYRGHVLGRDPHGLVGAIEAVGRASPPR